MNRAKANLSLQARLALALFATLAPFAVAAGIGILFLLPALLGPLEQIVGEVVEQMEPVRHLQVALLSAALAEHDRAADSGRVELKLEGTVQAGFERVRASPLSDALEIGLIDSAWQEWKKARSVQLQVEASGGRRQDSAIHRMADHAENAVAILDSVYFPARTQMERSRVAAREAKACSLGVTALAFALALLISIYAVLRLTRPLLADMAVLREGALRLAKGELSHRVAASGAAELNDLATAFNAMAQRIELDQAALARLATRDGLTGLLNRREILRVMRDELDRSRRYGKPFAVLLLDVDHFKAVNDTWGHPAGDEVLRAVAARIQNEVRPTDKPARYGGEEFMVLLPETPAEGAVLLAERIRSCIAELPAAASSGKPIAVTVSIGVAAYPGAGSDEEALVSAADRALYRAKEQGRNRVVRGDGETH